jgi:hypothetical protein
VRTGSASTKPPCARANRNTAAEFATSVSSPGFETHKREAEGSLLDKAAGWSSLATSGGASQGRTDPGASPTRRADRRRRRERRAAGASRRQAASTTPPLRVARRHHGRRRPQPQRQLETSMTAIRVATSAASALARVFRSGQRRCPRSRNVAPRRHSSRNPGLYCARSARQAGQCPRRGVANRRFPRGRCAFTRASRSSQRPQSIVTRDAC